MMKPCLLVALAILLPVTPSFAQTDERVIYAGVVDQKGNPITGLTEDDFIVREGTDGPRGSRWLANELSNQYRVTFARPSRLIPPKTTVISARDQKLKARGMLVR